MMLGLTSRASQQKNNFPHTLQQIERDAGKNNFAGHIAVWLPGALAAVHFLTATTNCEDDMGLRKQLGGRYWPSTLPPRVHRQLCDFNRCYGELENPSDPLSPSCDIRLQSQLRDHLPELTDYLDDPSFGGKFLIGTRKAISNVRRQLARVEMRLYCGDN